MGTDPRTWEVTLDAKPWSVNEQVRWHYRERAKTVLGWRQAFAILARRARVPHLPVAHLTCQTTVPPGARMYDVGNEFYAAKAAVDGLVDAGVLTNDTPRYVRSLTFLAPVRGTRYAMTITITEET